jgi:hypothetical protein
MEIKRPSAKIFKFGKKNKFSSDNFDDLNKLRFDLVSLANRIEKLKDQTPWPNWSQNQADSLKEFASQLNDVENNPPD